MKNLVWITKAEQTPYITNDGFQKFVICMKSRCAGMELWGRITVKGLEPHTVPIGKIPLGISKRTVSVRDTNALLKPGETTCLKIELYQNPSCTGTLVSVYENKSWPRSRHGEFYLSQTMHTDPGYTDYPETLRPLYTSYIDTAQKYIKDSHSRAQDKEEYKYAIESSWVLSEGYAKEKNADEIEALVDSVKTGFWFSTEKAMVKITASRVIITSQKRAAQRWRKRLFSD